MDYVNEFYDTYVSAMHNAVKVMNESREKAIKLLNSFPDCGSLQDMYMYHKE